MWLQRYILFPNNTKKNIKKKDSKRSLHYVNRLHDYKTCPFLHIISSKISSASHITRVWIAFLAKYPLPFGKQIWDIKEGENGSLRNAALSAFEEGAPFMGTALAAYRQCIGAEVVCHFHLLSIF